MKPVCAPCARFYRPKKNGKVFLEGMPKDGAVPGLREPERWSPYKLWSGDLWVCPDCHSEIIVGTGLAPIAVHHEPDFEDKRIRHSNEQGELFQVNDC